MSKIEQLLKQAIETKKYLDASQSSTMEIRVPIETYQSLLNVAEAANELNDWHIHGVVGSIRWEDLAEKLKLALKTLENI